jgi:hypothetical protein
MASDVDEVISGGTRDPGLRRNPHKTFAWRQFDPLQRVQYRLGIGGGGRRAINLDGLMVCSRVEQLFLGRIGDRHERDGVNTFCQAFDPAADGGQGGFVANEQPPIEIVSDHQRASRATDLDGISDQSLLRPPDRRSGRMQRNIDGQLLSFGIEVSRGEVAPFEIAPFARNVELDVIVGGWGREVLEVLATEDYYSQHSRRDIPLF